MGVLTDLIIADESEAAAIAAAELPIEEFPGIDVKGVDTIKLMTLQSILTGRPLDSLYEEYAPVAVESEDGPWVHLLPNELIVRLASCDEATLRGVARKWAATEEFQLGRWSEDDVARLLADMHTLASNAREANKRVFAWICL